MNFKSLLLSLILHWPLFFIGRCNGIGGAASAPPVSLILSEESSDDNPVTITDSGFDGPSVTKGSDRNDSNIDAYPLSKIEPHYPLLARREGRSGTVLLLAEISRDGHLEIALKRSSGHLDLDSSALKAVKKVGFMPAQINGDFLDSVLQLEIVFSLQDEWP
jgi:TonB family protein